MMAGNLNCPMGGCEWVVNWELNPELHMTHQLQRDLKKDNEQRAVHYLDQHVQTEHHIKVDHIVLYGLLNKATEKKKKRKKKYTVARERLCEDSLGEYWSRMAELDEEAGARDVSMTNTLPMGSPSTKAKHHRSSNVVMEEEKAAMIYTTSCTRSYTLPTSTKVGKNLILHTGPIVNENMTGAMNKRTVGVIRDVVKRTVELDMETVEMPSAQIHPARGGEVGAEEHEILVQRHVKAPQLLDLTATQLRGQTATQTTDYRELLFYSSARLEYPGVEHIVVGEKENIVTDVVLECNTATCKMGQGETV
jgi:hypothetical protein